jgi:hypothetical protein
VPSRTELDDDIIDDLRESRIADKRHDEVVDLLISVPLCDRHERMRGELAENRLDGWLWNRVRTRRGGADRERADQQRPGTQPAACLVETGRR